MNKLLALLILTAVYWGCSSPSEPQSYPQYDVAPRAGAIPFNTSWTVWAGVIYGAMVNTGEDTLRDVAMLFTLKNAEGDSILDESVGYFTLDRAEFKYYTSYPYKKVFDLAPGVRYNFWSASDTMRMVTWDATWWFTPIIDLPEGTSYNLSEEIRVVI